MNNSAKETKTTGYVLQVLGAVVDVKFENNKELPDILTALECNNQGHRLVLEVEQHIGDHVVRCIALDSTDGLMRGIKVLNTGEPIKVPVGPQLLGRIINLLGEPIDERGPIKSDIYAPIHRDAPKFTEQSTKEDILVTGIKVIDLLEPYSKGGKIGLFGGAGVGKTVLIKELIHNVYFVLRNYLNNYNNKNHFFDIRNDFLVLHIFLYILNLYILILYLLDSILFQFHI